MYTFRDVSVHTLYCTRRTHNKIMGEGKVFVSESLPACRPKGRTSMAFLSRTRAHTPTHLYYNIPAHTYIFTHVFHPRRKTLRLTAKQLSMCIRLYIYIYMASVKSGVQYNMWTVDYWHWLLLTYLQINRTEDLETKYLHIVYTIMHILL